MIFINVLLPAPFSPSTAWISPGWTVSDTLSFASTDGYRLVIPASFRRGVSAARCSTGRFIRLGISLLAPGPAYFATDNTQIAAPRRARQNPRQPGFGTDETTPRDRSSKHRTTLDGRFSAY